MMSLADTTGRLTAVSSGMRIPRHGERSMMSLVTAQLRIARSTRSSSGSLGLRVLGGHLLDDRPDVARATLPDAQLAEGGKKMHPDGSRVSGVGRGLLMRVALQPGRRHLRERSLGQRRIEPVAPAHVRLDGGEEGLGASIRRSKVRVRCFPFGWRYRASNAPFGVPCGSSPCISHFPDCFAGAGRRRRDNLSV